MKKEIENIEKKIKKAGRLESFFDKLADKITRVKCGNAIGLAALVFSTIFMPTIYYYIFGSIGLVCAIDLIVESKTHYGENICDNLCQKYSSKIMELEKQKERIEGEISQNVNKEEIEKVKKELGLNNKTVIEKTKTKTNEELEEEKK